MSEAGLSAEQTRARREELRGLLARALDVAVETIDGDCSAASCEAWDSLAQLRLVLALEERYAMRLSLDEIETATSLAEIERLVAATAESR